jgi:predicted phage terminase large subunit-like protein
MTRWSTKDLAGRIIELYSEQKRKIRIITKKAFDSETGKMLNDRILDKERYDNLIQTVGEDIVRANYDQEPIDLKGMLYGEFITYNEKPRFRAIHSICDTADEGKDYLCNIIYGITDEIEPKAYVIDVLYTQDSMEKTERELVKRLDEYQVDRAVFESNFGGKAFVKIIEKQSREAGNYKTLFEAFAQTQNKEARILAHASAVTRSVYMPFGWDKLFPIFYRDLTEYQRQGNNINDDGPDAITGIVERLNKNKKVLGSR